MVLNLGEENESYSPVINRYGQPQTKSYTKSYAEFDAEKEILKATYESELTGSELDDYLLQMGLLYNTVINPVYDAEFIPR